MAIIISDSIRKKEFKRGIVSSSDREVLMRTARTELSTKIKGDDLPKGAKILKAYGTSPSGAKRVVYMATSDSKDFFLLFFRDKNDALGKNITIANPLFKRELSKRLDLLLEDLSLNKYTTL